MADSTTAVVVSSKTCYLPPQVLIVEYSFPGVGTSSTSSNLVELELPAPLNTDYLHMPVTNLTGQAYAIQLIGILASSNSTDLDLHLLNKNDISKIDTINQVFSMISLNKSSHQYDIGDPVIMNCDDPMENKLYVYLNNNDGGNATGTVSLKLIYISVRDRA